MDKDIKEAIIKSLKDELEYQDSYGDSQWIMAVSIKKITDNTYLARTIIKTNSSTYVDGTDIKVNITNGKAEVDLSFIEDAPIFHGGEIADSIRWLEGLGRFTYIQPDNPFDNVDDTKEDDRND